MSDIQDVSVEEMFEIWRQSSPEGYGRRQVFNGDMIGWELEVDDDFCQDSKYQHATNVIHHVESGRYFTVNISRSGSPFTDWDYTAYDEPLEVEKKTRTIVETIWVEKKK